MDGTTDHPRFLVQTSGLSPRPFHQRREVGLRRRVNGDQDDKCDVGPPKETMVTSTSERTNFGSYREVKGGYFIIIIIIRNNRKMSIVVSQYRTHDTLSVEDS